jgi:hypothetical protein
MGKYEQAPKITNRHKPSNKGSFLAMNWEVFQAINQKIDTRHATARCLMMLLVGSGDGFRLAQKTALDRLGCGKDAYYDARNYLEKIGLITNDKENNEIVIHYDALLGNTETYSQEQKGYTENNSESNTETYSMGYAETYYNIKEIENKIYNNEAPSASYSGSADKSANRYQEREVISSISQKDLEYYLAQGALINIGNGVFQSKYTNKKVKLS